MSLSTGDEPTPKKLLALVFGTPVVFGLGNTRSRRGRPGRFGSTGIWLPGKGSRIRFAGFAGSVRVLDHRSAPGRAAEVSVWLKSPARCSSVGTDRIVVATVRCLNCSKLKKKKVFSFTDRTAKGCPPLVEVEGLARASGAVAEKIVGAQHLVTVELVKASVDLVGAGLAYQIHHAAAGATELCAGISHDQAKLLSRVH